MIDEEVLLALIAAIAADEDIAQPQPPQFRPLMMSGGGSAVPPPVPPLYLSGEIGNVDASTVVITFDQNITIASAAGVTIKADNVSQTISSATRQGNHAIVYFVLSAPLVFGDVVTWEYTGGTIAAEDDATPLGTVTAHTVTNNIPEEEDFMQASITLTNAQIKDTGTPYVIVPSTQTLGYVGAPTTIHVPIFATITVNTTAGVYTNVDPAAKFIITIGSDWSNDLINAKADSLGADNAALTYFTNSLGVQTDNAAPDTPHFHGIGPHFLNGYGLAGNIEDNALALVLSNASSGDLTGGHASNSLTVTVVYFIHTL